MAAAAVAHHRPSSISRNNIICEEEIISVGGGVGNRGNKERRLLKSLVDVWWFNVDWIWPRKGAPLVVLFRMVAAATCYKTCRASVFSGGRELGLASFESFMQNGPFIKTDSGIH